MGATTGDQKRELSAVLGVLAVVAAILVGIGVIGVAVSGLSGRSVGVAEAAPLCRSLNALVADDEDSAAEVVAILEEAGMGQARSAPWPQLCESLWERAHLLSAALDASIEDSCATARRELRFGRLEEAYDVLLRAGVTAENVDALPSGCALAWRVAAAAAADASSAATPTPTSQPTATPTESPSPAPSSATGAGATSVACELARRQLFQGKQSDAVATLKAAGASATSIPEACPGVWTVAAALVASSAPVDGNGAQQVGGWWDDFIENYAQPLATAGAWILGAWLALVVLARLLVELPLVRDLSSSRRSRRAAAWFGSIAVLLAPPLLGVLGVTLAAGWRSGAGVAVALAAVAGVGIVGAASLALWIATLRKLDIELTDEKAHGPTLEAIVARLRALATETGRSIELQSAPVLPDISSSLGDLSKAGWVVAVQNVAVFLIGIKPWRASVEISGPQQASVLVGRNGRTVDARQIRLDAPQFRDLDPLPSGVTHAEILAVFIAAQVLLALRPAYPADFEEGLNGATKADAVALQFVCETWYMRQPSSNQAVALLRRAVQVDPADRLSVATLKSAQFRKSDDIEELLRYGAWLEEQSS